MADAVKALTDIWEFCDLINFKGGQQNFYSLHRQMTEVNCRNQVEAVTKREYRRRIFLIPREHLKSTVNTVLYCLWRIYRNPDIRIIIGTNTKDLSTDFIRECRAYLEDEDLIDEVWNDRPHIDGPLIPRLTRRASGYRSDTTEAQDTKVIWNNYAIQVVRELKDKQPTLEALSVGMRPTGSHCDLIVLDDIVDFQNSDTPKKAHKVSRWAVDLESVVTKKPVKTQICPGFFEWTGNEVLINGTRWFSWDYYARFVGNSEEEREKTLLKTRYSAMVLSVYKNGRDNRDGYICPELFDAEVEADLLETGALTPKEFAAQYLNKIIAEQDITFSINNVKLIPAHDYKPKSYSICNYIDKTETDNTGNNRAYPFLCHLYVDLGSSSSSGDEYAIGVGGFDEKGRLHIPELRSGNWTPSQVINIMFEMADKFNLSAIWYEGGVGYQDSFRDRIKEEFTKPDRRPLVIHKFVPSRSVSKVDRIIRGLEPLIVSGRLYMMYLNTRTSSIAREIEFFNPEDKNNQDNCLDLIERISQIAKPMIAGNFNDSSAGRRVQINTVYGGCR